MVIGVHNYPEALYVRSRWNLKKSPEDQIGKVRTKLLQETETEKEKYPLLCKVCKNEITTVDHAIAVNGRHDHTFINPAGIPFHIGCFSNAWGCIAYGVPTYEYTWFAGFSWCVAICSNCFTHLGWFYQSGRESFFGFILDNLIKRFKTH